MTTISHHIHGWLGSVAAARSLKTYETYRNGIRAFLLSLESAGLKGGSLVSRLSEKHIGVFAAWLKDKSKSTEAVYLTAVRKFYKFLNAEEVTAFNMERVDDIISNRSRKITLRAPIFPASAIEKLLSSLPSIDLSPTKSIRVRQLRDIALILTLADTGLRIHEACALKRGDLIPGRSAVIIGKGDKQAKIFFTKRAAGAINRYLAERADLDGATGKLLATLPVFARHDKAIGRKIHPFTPVSGRNALKSIVEGLFNENFGITPHKLRHYFVTNVWRETQDAKLTQALGRHSSFQTTQRYIHLNEDDVIKGYRRAMKGK